MLRMVPTPCGEEWGSSRYAQVPLDGGERRQELFRTRAPGKALTVIRASLPIECQRTLDRAIQRLVHHPDFGREDVERPLDRQGGDRRAAGQRLDHHQAEGVGTAGEDEDIGRAVDRRQILAELGAQEMHTGILRRQAGTGGTISDDDLAARRLGGKEGGDVLFDRDPSGSLSGLHTDQ